MLYRGNRYFTAIASFHRAPPRVVPFCCSLRSRICWIIQNVMKIQASTLYLAPCCTSLFGKIWKLTSSKQWKNVTIVHENKLDRTNTIEVAICIKWRALAFCNGCSWTGYKKPVGLQHILLTKNGNFSQKKAGPSIRRPAILYANIFVH